MLKGATENLFWWSA